jgi:hypothetical protein
MVLLQEPNQRAVGVLAMEALIAGARPSPWLAATHRFALESGSTENPLVMVVGSAAWADGAVASARGSEERAATRVRSLRRMTVPRLSDRDVSEVRW